MTRAESLRTLHSWAEYGPFFPIHQPTRFDPDSTLAARSHGLAAVQAIRDVFVPCYECLEDDCSTRREVIPDAVHESRLAVRAALTACGIRGAL